MFDRNNNYYYNFQIVLLKNFKWLHLTDEGPGRSKRVSSLSFLRFLNKISTFQYVSVKHRNYGEQILSHRRVIIQRKLLYRTTQLYSIFYLKYMHQNYGEIWARFNVKRVLEIL